MLADVVTRDGLKWIENPQGVKIDVRVVPEFKTRFINLQVTSETSASALFTHLWPIQFHVIAKYVNISGMKTKSWVRTCEGEIKIWYAMFLGGALAPPNTRSLWSSPNDTRTYINPGMKYERFMTRHRFEDVKRHMHFCDLDLQQNSEDPWFLVRELINSFNENRRTNIYCGSR